MLVPDLTPATIMMPIVLRVLVLPAEKLMIYLPIKHPRLQLDQRKKLPRQGWTTSTTGKLSIIV